MITARVRKARQSDIEIISDNMRQSDIDELWASDHIKPKEALERSYKDSSICFTIDYKGNPIGMFGVVPYTTIQDWGSIWLLATNDLCHVNRQLIRRSKYFIQILLRYFTHLENHVSCENIASIKWLAFCGAKLNPPEPYGPDNKMFQRFVFEQGVI